MRRAVPGLLLALAVAVVAGAACAGEDPGSNRKPLIPSTSAPAVSLEDSSTVDAPAERMLAVGDLAPEFTLEAAPGKPAHLADLAGQWVVLVFAGNCRLLGVFGDADAELRGLGARLCGVCQDGSAAVASYVEREHLPFPILSDPTVQVSQLYGMLADDGRIKIGDFGLARAASANTATGAALLGTIAYLSPELVTRGIADTRSDIYAVGIMLFEALTGRQPFTAPSAIEVAT